MRLGKTINQDTITFLEAIIDAKAVHRASLIKQFIREIRAHFGSHKPSDLKGLNLLLIFNSRISKESFLGCNYLPRLSRIPESKWYYSETKINTGSCPFIETNLGTLYYCENK